MPEIYAFPYRLLVFQDGQNDWQRDQGLQRERWSALLLNRTAGMEVAEGRRATHGDWRRSTVRSLAQLNSKQACTSPTGIL